jgi:predicted DCC family thiol-disulfide oxidoreductase YuxK
MTAIIDCSGFLFKVKSCNTDICHLLENMENSNTPIVLFDGVCNLCNRAVQFIIKRDPKGKFKFASLQSDPGQALLKDFNVLTGFDSFVLIEGDRFFVRSTEALRVLRGLGGLWKLFYGFMIVPKPVRDFVYDRVAKSRYRIFGRRESCMIPTGDLKERFL